MATTAHLAFKTPDGVRVEAVADRIQSDSGLRHGFVTLTIHGLSEANPTLKFTPGDFGAGHRLINVNPQPLGEHFSVVWNGDTTNPEFHFDGWFGDVIRVRAEFWSK